MRTRTKLLLGGVGAALAAWVGRGVHGARSAERVPYETLRFAGDGTVELRRYPRMVLAETTVPDEESALRRLFDYLSGANDRSEGVSMTAPVRTEDGSAGVTMAFFLPAEYTPETAPAPTDPDVRLAVEAPRTVAVKPFSYRATDHRVTNAEDSLLATLEREGIDVRGEPALLRYNDPHAPPFLRRTEVAVEVDVDAS